MPLPLGLLVGLAHLAESGLHHWASRQEALALAKGIPLPPAEITFAQELEIVDPESIRWMIVDPIPLPAPASAITAAKKAGFPVFHPAGMALGRSVWTTPAGRGTLRHELVHVAQYQRLGGIRPFLRTYLLQCFTHGYHDAPLEVEARLRSR